MNALLCKPCVTTDAELDIYNIPGLQEDFATRPMQAIQPENIVTDEEALHASFEEAISDRIDALNMNWSHTRSTFARTGPLGDTAVKQALSTLTSSKAAPHKNKQITLPGKGWQRGLTYVCIALMFMLIGFDLMGLLILHLH